jgi:lipoprotein-anchoring transpeptidase ErfK/SrfK
VRVRLPRGIRAAAIAVSVSTCVSAIALAPARADSSIAPVIVGVDSGDRSVAIRYEVATDPAITGYQASPDGFSWFDCPDVSGTCSLSSLTNGREYRVSLRAIGPNGPSPAAPLITALPMVPAGSDPDKPVDLPRPRVQVTAKFDAAGNDLGVRNPRTKLGVGTLPHLTFSRAIPNKRAVESHLVVTATDAQGRTREVPGAWGWVSDRTAVFRPKDFWPGNSTITITSTLDNAVMGRSGGRFLVGAPSLRTTYSFRTDRSLIATVNGATKEMDVVIDGRKRKTFKVSLGGPGWETRNGAKVISTSKEPNKVYRSASLGLTDPDDFYELPAKWNTRLTPTGEFLHTAAWAYGRLGRYNGSHGCTNMFEQDAKWIFDNTIPGDVVEYVKTGGDTMEPWNGPGGLWNIPWSKWLKKSALGSGSSAVDTSDEETMPADARPDGA